jgi:hypothetical protein
MRTRLLIGLLGLAMGAFGALRFLQLDLAGILDALLWLAGGVAIHDAVIAPLTIGLTVLATRVVPRSARLRITVGLVVLATVTTTAVPVLGRWGARPDNPTLLDRGYLGGWLVFAALVLLAMLLSGPAIRLVRRARGERVSRSAG